MPVSASRKLRIQRKKEKKKEKETNQQNKEKRWVRRTTEIKSKNNNSDKFCLRLAGAGLCSTHTTQNSPCHCHRLLSAILSHHNTKQSMSLSHAAIHHNTHFYKNREVWFEWSLVSTLSQPKSLYIRLENKSKSSSLFTLHAILCWKRTGEMELNEPNEGSWQ